MTGRATGATGAAFTEYLMETLQDPILKQKWEGFVK